MQVKATVSSLLIGALLALLLTSCATKPPVKERPDFLDDPEVVRATQAYELGDFSEASRLYGDLATRAPTELKTHFLLLAADSYLLGGSNTDSRLILALLDETTLRGDDALRYRLIRCGLLLGEKEAEGALDLLVQPPEEDAPADLRQRYYRNKAQAYLITGNAAGRIQQLQSLDQLLEFDEQRLSNQIEILRSLIAAGETTLESLQPVPGGIEAGWLALADLLKVYQRDPQGIIEPYQNWQTSYPGHPALPELLESYFRYRESLYLEINTVAVLLPQSGPYAKAADSIRNGIMAAWYAEPINERPEIRFYDSTDADKVWPLVNQVADSGADVIVGPLNKSAVLQLARSGEIPSPVLALNQVITDSATPGDLYQYSLSPEGEARQVAEMAWLEGMSYPVILSPANSWGDRLAKAFAARWEQLGGQPPSQQQYDPASNDFSGPVRHLLKLDESTARNLQLQRMLGKQLKFEPRRRADADFVFLVAKDRQARQIKPQLAFHYAADLPVLSTSHAWTGRLTHQHALDARGIRLPDIPWLIDRGSEDTLSRQNRSRIFPASDLAYGRLYAMGIDSYRLLPHLRRLESTHLESIDGVTGILYMDRNKHVHRQLVWITLDENPVIQGYSPRMDLIEPSMSANEPETTDDDNPPPPQTGSSTE